MSVPDEWRPIARLCADLEADCDRLVEAIVERILGEVPYITSGEIDRPELTALTRVNTLAILTGLSERRGPRKQELELPGEIGRRRAQSDQTVDAVLAVFFVGLQELWAAMTAHPSAEGRRVRELLLDAIPTVLEWYRGASDSIRVHYHAERERRATLLVGRRERLLDAIISGQTDRPELIRLAADLRIEQEQPLIAALAQTEPRQIGTVDELNLDGSWHATLRGEELIAVIYDGQSDAFLTAVQRRLPGMIVAVGLPRPGLEGAHQSLQDARRALPIAIRERRSVRYEDVWLAATLLAQSDELEPLLRPGIAAAEAHPVLASTVRAYADCGQSLTAAAAKLNVHLNTVAYRLKRWHEQTGWDTRSRDGLLRSLAAIECAPPPATRGK